MPKEFNFILKVTIDSNHPEYNLPDRILKANIAMLVMNGMSGDSNIGYTLEVI